jgi:hypothetical protein
MPDPTLIEAAARGFAQGLVGVPAHPPPTEVPPALPASSRRRRVRPPESRQLPLVPEVPAPVAELGNGEPLGPVVTQADLDRMERVLRGEVAVDAYVPEDAEPKPWLGG